ncbi:MAG: VOC family protein [Acidimicrobiales bacterium]|nr:VOC family protein [Acidimicrobiales bacterium]
MMRPEDQYHVGIVVEDYEATLERLGTLFGYVWGEEISSVNAVTLASGETVELKSSFCYSLNGPRLEIIRSNPGTVWVPASSGIHHLGYWSDDVAADGAALEAQGYELEQFGPGPDGDRLYSYHRHPDGPRIEFVTRAVLPMFEQYWVDGKAPF